MGMNVYNSSSGSFEHATGKIYDSVEETWKEIGGGSGSEVNGLTFLRSLIGMNILMQGSNGGTTVPTGTSGTIYDVSSLNYDFSTIRRIRFTSSSGLGVAVGGQQGYTWYMTLNDYYLLNYYYSGSYYTSLAFPADVTTNFGKLILSISGGQSGYGIMFYNSIYISLSEIELTDGTIITS